MSPGIRHAASALVATTVGVLPSFLFGGLAPLIRSDLGFEARWIGIGVACYFATSSLSSVHAGRLGERLGSRYAMWLGIGISATVLAGIGLFARSLPTLLAFLAFAGFGNAIIQPAANLALARGVGEGRRGLAFGFKQAAIPVASGLGGFAVPTLGLTLGWRSAFLSAALLPLLAAALPLPDRPGAVKGRNGARALAKVPLSLWLLCAGIGLGSAASNAMGAYLVEAATVGGWRPGQAGIILGIGSVSCIMARVGVGWISDRMQQGWLRLVGIMMMVGGLGFWLLTFLENPLILAIALPLAFVAGWGYNGLFIFSVVKLHPNAPASATGVTQAGGFGGAVVGPPLFGVVVDLTSYAVGWTMLAVMSVVGGVCVLFGRARVFAERAQESGT